jgi:hypothetical protein
MTLCLARSGSLKGHLGRDQLPRGTRGDRRRSLDDAGPAVRTAPRCTGLHVERHPSTTRSVVNRTHYFFGASAGSGMGSSFGAGS